MRQVNIFIIALGIASCSAMREGPSRDVRWDAIGGLPSGRVSLCGWLDIELETCTLAKKNDTPLAERIWITPRSLICLPVKPYSGWAKVSGMWREGGGFGPLGQYERMLDNANVELRTESCPAE